MSDWPNTLDYAAGSGVYILQWKKELYRAVRFPVPIGAEAQRRLKAYRDLLEKRKKASENSLIDWCSYKLWQKLFQNEWRDKEREAINNALTEVLLFKLEKVTPKEVWSYYFKPLDVQIVTHALFCKVLDSNPAGLEALFEKLGRQDLRDLLLTLPEFTNFIDEVTREFAQYFLPWYRRNFFDCGSGPPYPLPEFYVCSLLDRYDSKFQAIIKEIT